MSQIWGIPLVIFIALNWVLYHKIFHVTYFGNLARGIFNELIWCTLVAMLELSVIMYLGGSVLGFVGSIVSVIFKVVIFLVAIIAAIFVIYKIHIFLKKDKSAMSEQVTEKVGGLFSKFNTGNKADTNADASDKICCSVCGNPISEDDKFCINCGTKIDVDIEKVSEQSEERISNTMLCPVCGNTINEGDKFCTACGRKI